MIAWTKFFPFETLARQVLPLAETGNDGAHDLAHLMRVWANAFAIADADGGDREVIAASVLLHDCVAVEKNSPQRAQASKLAAVRASEILTGLSWAPERTDQVAHAIAAHSFSAGITPRSLEAQVLQDADRLDAIGMIGVARCFYTAGRLGSSLYDTADPRALHRELDDALFALDHFRAKLLRLGDGFQTPMGTALARDRTRGIAEFMVMFETEIGAFDT